MFGLITSSNSSSASDDQAVLGSALVVAVEDLVEPLAADSLSAAQNSGIDSAVWTVLARALEQRRAGARA